MDTIARPLLLRLSPDDNIAVAMDTLPAGTPLDVSGAVTRQETPRGHKVAVRAIAAGEAVLKFGQFIGEATAAIAPGEHVHTHNLIYRRHDADAVIGSARRGPEVLPEPERATFEGFVRPDGRVGTRNYIGVLPSVNCSATVVRMIAERFRAPGALDAFPNVDGVVSLSHRTGCGMASEGEEMDQLRRVLAGYARHPNFAGVLVIGLGCEANQISRLLEAEHLEESDRLHTFVMQETGGTTATVRAGEERVRAMLPAANAARRQTVSAEHLMLALQCGGSDGFSGITANPALGAAADLIVRNGGTVVLGETPEIYGAEAMLLRRAVSTEVGRKLLDRLAWWHDYTGRNGGTMDNNPSPGNKAGGLTTILEKSLGAAAKGGTTDLVDVATYAEPVRARGFVFMDTPGYDPVSVTGQIAGGCNVVCFTTGRGSCFGAKPVPSLKLATNTPLYRRMEEDMDINCGDIADGTASVAELGQQIFKTVLRAASGEKTKSELLGYGDDEFAPWVLGATV